LLRWIPVAVYIVLILVASSIPNLRSPGGWVGSDKAWHLLEYAVLGGLLRRAFGRPGTSGWAAALTAAAAVAALDEFYQSLVPGRFSSFYDWTADLFGAGIGSALAPVLTRWSTRVRSRGKRTGD
jgi:VanZ family protein